MSSEQPRRSSRDNTGSVASPMGSTAAIVIAVIAVVAGFLILRSIQSDDGGGSSPAATTVPAVETTAPAVVVTTAAPDTTPTTIAPTTEGATVVVANASRVDGAAGVLTTALNAEGFTMGDPTNAGGAEPKLDISKIYQDPANPQALPVAQYLASLMGGIEVAVMPVPPPVQDGALAEGVTVLVMLGSDKAALTLEQMGVPTTTIAGAVVETTTTVAG
jgi:LytR cell envelope-related transcriptional attenuator